MRQIVFQVTLSEVKTVEISEVSGGMGAWHVRIDGYYHGVIVKRAGKWVFEPHNRSDWQTEDMQILCELVEKEVSGQAGIPE